MPSINERLISPHLGLLHVQPRPKAILVILLLLSFSPSHAAPGDVLWEFIAAGTPVSTPAVAPNGNIVISTIEGRVQTISPAGESVWVSQNLGRFNSSPVLAQDGTVYVASDRLYALNGNTGQVIWSFIPGSSGESLVLLGEDGTIYLRDILDNETVYAINPNGTLKWSSPLDNSFRIRAVVRGNTLFFTSTPSFRTKLGDLLRVSSSGAVTRIPTTLEDEMIILGVTNAGHILLRLKRFDTQVFALSENGEIIWSTDLGASNEGTGAAVGEDGTLYISGDGRLFALTPSGGRKWTINLPGNVSNPVVGNDGIVYLTVDGSVNEVFAVSPEGNILWNLRDFGNGFGSPVLGPDGTLYISGTSFFNFGILAIDTSSTGLARSAWPMVNGNPQHTRGFAFDCYRSDNIENSNCTSAGFAADRLTIPAVDVEGEIYTVEMDLIPNTSPFNDFRVISATAPESTSKTSGSFHQGKLVLPFVTVGADTFDVEMLLIDEDTLRFRLTRAVQVNLR